jgi:hypothetical protein
LYFRIATVRIELRDSDSVIWRRVRCRRRLLSSPAKPRLGGSTHRYCRLLDMLKPRSGHLKKPDFFRRDWAILAVDDRVDM